MLSEKYVEKRERYYKIYEFIFKFRILLCILLACIVTISATLMGIKGIVINDFIVSDSTYGSKLEYSSKVIFGNVEYYEFRSENSQQWTREEPKLVGNYYLRGVGKSIFGNLRYGKEEAFTINPINIDLDTSTMFEYGSKPIVIANLQYSDFIPEFDYEIISETSESNKYNCKIDQSSFRILNKDSIDVTSCYKINFKDSYEFVFSSKAITVSSKYECVYDGEKHKSDEVEVTSGELVDKDYITIDKQDSFINAGSYFNKPTLKITSKNNIDVTNLYKISYSSNSYLTINKRPITIETLNFKREYDATSNAFEASFKINDGSLVNGDTFKIFTPYKEEVGTYENKGDYYILSKDNKDVTSNYDITIVPGEYTITPRKARVEVYCFDKEYNANWNDNLSSESSNLLDGHFVSLNAEMKYAFANVYKDHEVDVKILDNNYNDVTKNYELTIKYKNGFEVTKIPLTIEVISAEFVYDGKYKYSLDYEITSGELLEGETIEISNYPKYKDLGKYENYLGFTIRNNVLGDVTSCYSIEEIPGTITIVEESSGDGGSGGSGSESGGSDSGGSDSGGSGSGGSGSGGASDQEEDEDSDQEVHLFYYDAKTKGQVFLTEKVNFGYYNGKTYDKIEGYTIKNDYNPEEYINYLLGSLVTKAEGTIILPESRERTSDIYLNYPKFDRKQKKDTFPQISDLYNPIYDVSGLHYDYLKNPDLLNNLSTSVSFNEAEADYRKYVKANYNGVDDYTLNFLKKYIEEYSLDGNSIKEIALNLIKHIKKYFKYSTQPKNITAKDKEHPFVSFLRDTKIGKCDYFATFGTLVFRTLGYSARMITGYSTGGGEIKTYDVTNKKAHAICQVYIDGKGWVNFEFTVAENIDPTSPSNGTEASDYDVLLQSSSKTFTYDGKYHNFNELNIDSNIGSVTVRSTFGNGYMRVGTYDNIFDSFVYDSNGNLIDEKVYTILKNYGKITILPKEMTSIGYGFSASLNQLNGNKLSASFIGGDMVEEDEITEFTILNDIEGTPSGENRYMAIISKIVNKNGEDVTNCYVRKVIFINVNFIN